MEENKKSENEVIEIISIPIKRANYMPGGGGVAGSTTDEAFEVLRDGTLRKVLSHAEVLKPRDISIAHRIADWLANEDVQFPQNRAEERPLIDAFKRAADAIRIGDMFK